MRRRDDTPVKEEVKEEPEDVKPPLIPAGFEVPPALHDEAHDGEFTGLSFGLVASATEIERDSPGFLETVERSAMAASASTSAGAAGASTSRAHHDGASTSRTHHDSASTSHADSSSTLILLDDSDNSGDSFDWSAESE